MAADIIDGKAIARALRAEVAAKIKERVESGHRPPGLAVVLVGTDSAAIARELLSLLTNHFAYEAMANAVNPYGDGRAAERIADHLEYRFGLRAAAPGDFG